MTKNILIAIIVVQFALLAHAVIKIQKQDAWLTETETRIYDLRQATDAMQNTCELYLNQDLFLPDNGNNQSK